MKLSVFLEQQKSHCQRRGQCCSALSSHRREKAGLEIINILLLAIGLERSRETGYYSLLRELYFLKTVILQTYFPNQNSASLQIFFLVRLDGFLDQKICRSKSYDNWCTRVTKDLPLSPTSFPSSPCSPLNFLYSSISLCFCCVCSVLFRFVHLSGSRLQLLF